MRCVLWVAIMDTKEINSEIQNIVEQIIHKYRPSKIILFGSAAQGEYDKVNDLDFLIIKQDVPLYGIDRMRELDELIDLLQGAELAIDSTNGSGDNNEDGEMIDDGPSDDDEEDDKKW